MTESTRNRMAAFPGILMTMLGMAACAPGPGLLGQAAAFSPQTSTVAVAALSLPSAAFPAAKELRRFPAAEAHQGVASSADSFYAIADHEIGRYNKTTGQQTAHWSGEPPAYIHINSCNLVRLAARQELVCAMSNFPGVPQTSSIEFFDPATLRHLRTRALGPGRGSLTWVDWHGGSWWACFANYDAKGGEPPRDHRSTVLVRFTPEFVAAESWLFPEDVLDSFGHMSASGGRWGKDRLYVTGHDLPEMYVLALPEGGSRLRHVGTIALPTGGQAFDWDFTDPARMWSIDRKGGEVVESQLPAAVR